MVTPARGAYSSGAVRALNMPRPLRVKADAEATPSHVWARRAWNTVASIAEHWRVEHGWWRGVPVSRHYWAVVLEEGQRMTLFQDAASEEWYEQSYG